MSEEMKKMEMNEEQLDAVNGGCDGMSRGVVRTVCVASGYLALRTAAAYKYENEIEAMYNGQTVTIYTNERQYNPSENNTYVWVCSNKTGKVGWTNEAYLR